MQQQTEIESETETGFADMHPVKKALLLAPFAICLGVGAAMLTEKRPANAESATPAKPAFQSAVKGETMDQCQEREYRNGINFARMTEHGSVAGELVSHYWGMAELDCRTQRVRRTF